MESFIASLAYSNETRPANALAALNGLVQGLARKGAALMQLPLGEREKSWLFTVAANETKTALDNKAMPDSRTRAIALLALLEFPNLQPIATKLLQPGEADAIRVATIKLLGQQKDAKVAELLLETWPTLTPAPREAALQALIAKPASVDALLSALEQNRIKPAEISATARSLLTKTSNAKLRERATKLFAPSGTRAEVIATYHDVPSLKGDIESGHKVYQTICAACHRKGEEGRDIGPNLATVLSWTPEQLLTNILDPNREVAPNFLLYIVETNDGRVLSGIIMNETPASVSLKGADGNEQSVPRSEVKSLKSAGISLMPEGLEAAINPQQLADLIAFIRGQ
jgi:putative heme-binding domain-containing protein